MGDTSSAAVFLKDLDERRKEALARVGEAQDARLRAENEYEAAVLAAHEVGCSNAEIGRAVDMSETAIRLFLKRRKS